MTTVWKKASVKHKMFNRGYKNNWNS